MEMKSQEIEMKTETQDVGHVTSSAIVPLVKPEGEEVSTDSRSFASIDGKPCSQDSFELGLMELMEDASPHEGHRLGSPASPPMEE
eukprot:4127050-Amphidinium_carterae.1